MRFRPRAPELDALDPRSVERWKRMPDDALGPGLGPEARHSLAALLAEVWELEHPSTSFVDDPSDACVVEWLPDFVPAPSYEWGRTRHPESGVLFFWTRADPHAERATTLPIDPYEMEPGIEIEERETTVLLTCDDGAGDSAQVEIGRHAIELLGIDEEPPCLVRAIQAFTGWAAATPDYWGDHGGEQVFLVAELVACSACGEVRESGLAYATRCEHCGASAVGLSRTA